MRRRIDDFRPVVADRIAFLNRGKGINVPDVQSAIEKVYSEINRTSPTTEIVSVKDFGAVGDGATDDRQAIMDALAYLSTRGGGELLLPHGIYKINQPIVFSGEGNFTFRGSGNTIIDASGMNNSATAFFIGGQRTEEITLLDIQGKTLVIEGEQNITANDILRIRTDELFNDQRGDGVFTKGELCEIESIVFQGGNTIVVVKNDLYDEYDFTEYTPKIQIIKPIRNVVFRDFEIRMGGKPKNQIALIIENFAGVLVDNVRVSDAERSGIWVNVGIGANIINCTVKNVNHDTLGYGIYLQHVQHGIIQNNHGFNCRHSIEIAGTVARDIIVKGNVVTGDTKAGISTHGGTEFITFDGNHIHNSGNGIVARGRSHTITNNRIHNPKGDAIIIGEANDDAGRRGEAGKNIIVSNNYIEGGVIGLYAPVRIENAQITNNVFINLSQSGMLFNGRNVTNTIIEGNTLIGVTEETTGSGIAIIPFDRQNNNETLLNVSLLNNTVLGFYDGFAFEFSLLEESPSNTVLIKGNTIKDNKNRGISFRSGIVENVMIVDNIVLNNQASNINIGSASVTNLVRANNID